MNITANCTSNAAIFGFIAVRTCSTLVN